MTLPPPAMPSERNRSPRAAGDSCGRCVSAAELVMVRDRRYETKERFSPPLVTLSDEEPIAAGGWWIFNDSSFGVRVFESDAQPPEP